MGKRDLASYLMAKAVQPELMRQALRTAGPIFRMTAEGRFHLAAAGKGVVDGLAPVIAAATGVRVAGVIPISLAGPVPDDLADFGNGTGGATDKKLLREGVIPGNVDDLRRGISAHLGGRLWKALGKDSWLGLRDRFRFGAWVDLGRAIEAEILPALRQQMGQGPGFGLSYNLWYSLGSVVFHHLGFALAGDQTAVGLLAPLVASLDRALPVGEKSDRAGVWYVLVA